MNYSHKKVLFDLNLEKMQRSDKSERHYAQIIKIVHAAQAFFEKSYLR